MKKFFYSIATHNYLSQLMCAEKSLLDNESIHASYIFVLDAKKEHINFLNNKFIDSSRNITFFCFDDIDKYKDIFEKASKYYDNFEMSCLAKVTGASYILDLIDEDDLLIYCDADLYFKSSIKPLIEEMTGRDILLTPHIINKEKDSKDEHGYLIHGWINAGFMIFRKGNPIVYEILDWLVDRIYLRGFNAPSLFMFVDQAWISALPYLFRDSISISSNLSSNVAYWNLNERKIIKNYETNQYEVNSNSLIFFHFSGFKKNNINLLSKHYDFNESKEDYLEIYELMNEYNDELILNEEIEKNLSNLDTSFYNFSKDKLRERLLIAEKVNKINLVNPTYKEGFLSKIARRIEAFYIS